MLNPSSLAKWGVAALLLSSLSSCEDLLDQYFPKPNPAPPTVPTQPVAYTTYVTSGPGNTYQNGLLIFNPSTLTPTRQLPITGLGATDHIFGFDLRPATGQLYALVGNYVTPADPFQRAFVANGRLYTIDPATGAATLVGPISIPLRAYGDFGFDFNPVVDRIRLVSDQGQNLRVNPADGVAIEDGRINGGIYGGAKGGGVAYDNNVARATSTNLYLIDVNEDKFYRMDLPTTGTITEIGPLGRNVSFVGFDIGGTSNQAYAVMDALDPADPNNTNRRTTHLYAMNLATGAPTDLGDFGFPSTAFLTGFALGAGF